MQRSEPVDGFRLAYDRAGQGPPVLLLHGWPGDRSDYRDVLPLLPGVDAVVPDLRGFGSSDKHPAAPAEQYSADAQTRSLLGLLDQLGLDRPVIGGYDIGSRVAQTLARQRPDRVRALVISPPVPGVGRRILAPEAQREFWYQQFHQLPLAERLVDGDRAAVREYLWHFWTHWSGPGFVPVPADLDHLAEVYGAPGAFVASIGWYRAGAGAVARALAERPPPPDQRISPPTTLLWPEHDPLFPADWGDRVDEFFSAATLRWLPGVGHFVPREAPAEFAAALLAASTDRGSPE
jgi:pimeloyl-ACP methyl ester carboxylesterase